MAAANRVLLVDDESKIVDALQRLLRPLRETWTVSTATSAKAALDLLGRESFEVVVSDMRMPEMDGATLLAIVKERFPATARVILSGQTEKSAALRAVPVAHQFLQKPCPPSTLLELLSRRAQYPFADADLRRRIGAIDSLPCDPGVARALCALVDGGKIRLAEVTALVKTEPVLILKLLQLSSSSFFGTGRALVDLAHVISVAGEDLLQTLAASALASSATQIPSARFDLDAFRRHSIEIANAARSAAVDPAHAETCFVAGMLHEIGKILLATHAADKFDAIADRVTKDGISFGAGEVAEGIESHARIGAALLDLWGLPKAIVGAVAHHADPDHRCDPSDAAAAVRLAHVMSNG